MGFGAGETTALGDDLAGSCGGAGAPERLHLYRHGDIGFSVILGAILRLAIAAARRGPEKA